MSTAAVAQMLSIMLYQKRFFPFYSWCILGGLDEEGKGAVYTYDPVGSYERESCRCAGSASSLIQPFLDNQVTGLGHFACIKQLHFLLSANRILMCVRIDLFLFLFLFIRLDSRTRRATRRSFHWTRSSASQRTRSPLQQNVTSTLVTISRFLSSPARVLRSRRWI